MKDHKEHIKEYTAADIQRYVQGKLSPREMHALEMAALDDPFLADAIEGMQEALQEHDEKLVTGQLQELKQAIQAQAATPQATITSTAKVVTFRWWQVAAAAVVIVITGFWMYTLFTTNTTEKQAASLAQHKQEQVTPPVPTPATPPATATTAPSTGADTNAKMLDANSNLSSSGVSYYSYNSEEPKAATLPKVDLPRVDLPKVDLPNVAAGRAPSSSSPVIVAESAAPPVANADKYDDSMGKLLAKEEARKPMPENTIASASKQFSAVARNSSSDQDLKKAKDDALFPERETELITISKSDSGFWKKLKKDNASVGFDKKGDTLSGFVKGQVIDHKNNPIAYAYLNLPYSNNNFYTDKSGFFKIPVADSVVDVAVNVSGYNTQNFRLKKSNDMMNRLQMQRALNYYAKAPASTLDNKAKFSAANIPGSLVGPNVEPTYGWVAYNQYIEKNKKVPTSPTLNGKVVVTFEVNKKGLLSDFKIEQSLNSAYDAEAIRLVKAGPAWTVLKGHKARATVVVNF